MESPLVWEELIGSEWDYDYEVEPQARGNSKLRHSRARLLGGCSSHNSVIAFIPPDSDFSRWEREGAQGWGPQGVTPFFERVRSKVGTFNLIYVAHLILTQDLSLHNASNRSRSLKCNQLILSIAISFLQRRRQESRKSNSTQRRPARASRTAWATSSSTPTPR